MVKAIYAGSFDPPTMGHLDIITRALGLFDELHLLVAVNPAKHGLFSIEERIGLLSESLPSFPPERILCWEGPVAEYALKEGCTVLVRGLRGFADFEPERDMAFYNQRLGEGLETIFLLAAPRYVSLSSSAVKELHRYRKPLDGLVPGPVIAALDKRVSTV